MVGSGGAQPPASSSSTPRTFLIHFSIAIDQDLAKVISMSYGGCEYGDLVDLPTIKAPPQQANAEGITWMAAPAITVRRLRGSGRRCRAGWPGGGRPGHIPEVTSVGGTNSTNRGSPTGAARITRTARRRSHTSGEGVERFRGRRGHAAGGGGASQVFFKPSGKPAWASE